MEKIECQDCINNPCYHCHADNCEDCPSASSRRNGTYPCGQYRCWIDLYEEGNKEALNANTILQQLLEELETQNIKALLKKIVDAYNDDSIPEKTRNALGFITADYETLLGSIYASKDQIERLNK